MTEEEEIIRDIYYSYNLKEDSHMDIAKKIAHSLHFLGYKKLPENSVVLTQEEAKIFLGDNKFKYHISLPCKPGDTIYTLTLTTREHCLRCKHDHSGFMCICDLDYRQNTKPEDIFKGKTICPKFKLRVEETTFNTNYYLSLLDYFNVTWFLTEQEAQTQLKKVKAILKEKQFIDKEIALKNKKKSMWD